MSTAADDDAYANALLRHTDQVLHLFVGERLINKIFARVFQSHAMGRLVIAHFDWRAGAGPGPTLSWLQKRTGCGRTLAAFIGVARVARLVSVIPDPADARRRQLVPGPRVIDGLRLWLIHHLELAEALSLIPAGCAARLCLDTPYFEAFVRASIVVVDHLDDWKRDHPLWQWFEAHECGQRIAYAYLREHFRGCLASGAPFDQPRPVPLTGGQVAAMLGLSKSHVRNVLNGAERLGILAHDERRRSICLSEHFLKESRGAFVQLLALMAQAHDGALALLAAPSVRTPG